MRRTRTKIALCSAVLAGVMAPSAQAGLLAAEAPACTSSDGSTVFRPWLDPARYVPAPGGSLESTAGWSLSGGAGLVAGNEPFFVGDESDANSLRLPSGSAATTDVACVGIEHPTLRFFVRSTNTNVFSSLRVDVSFVGPLGNDMRVPIGVVSGTGGSWTPSPTFLVVANLLPLLPGDHTPVRFSFVPQGAGTWQIDDAYIDPWRTG